jgi:predicted nucleotidyltransferase component of viral defense system
MAELFLQLNKKERGDALGVAAEKGRLPMHLLEKDVWVVWALRTMFASAFGPNLIFKGGTSL